MIGLRWSLGVISQSSISEAGGARGSTDRVDRMKQEKERVALYIYCTFYKNQNQRMSVNI